MNQESHREKPGLRELELATREMPAWLSRGSPLRYVAVLAVILVLAMAMPWNETLRVPVTIRAGSPPLSVTSQQSGVLSLIMAEPGATVRSGDVLAVFGDPEEIRQVDELADTLPELRAALRSGKPLPALPTVTVGGEIQETVSGLFAAINAFESARRFPLEQRDAAIVRTAIEEIVARRARLSADVSSADELVANSQERLRLKSELAEQGWVSVQGVSEAQAELIERQVAARQARARIAEDEARLAELRLQLDRTRLSLDQSVSDLRAAALQAVEDAAGSVADWRREHRLVAPAAGTVQFPLERIEGQYVKPGEEIAVILPSQNRTTAVGIVSNAQRGSVEIGTPVRLEIAGIPASANGYLAGRVTSAAPVAIDEGYEIRIALTNGATSSAGIELPLRDRSAATGHIVLNQGRVATMVFGGIIERIRSQP